MSIRLVFMALLCVVLCGAFTTLASAEVPSTTMHLGDSGPQVLLLQQLLNKSPDTQVAASGAGSPGMESSYFGAKTLDAVKRYQAKYSTQILVPAGPHGKTMEEVTNNREDLLELCRAGCLVGRSEVEPFFQQRTTPTASRRRAVSFLLTYVP